MFVKIQEAGTPLLSMWLSDSSPHVPRWRLVSLGISVTNTNANISVANKIYIYFSEIVWLFW